MKYGIFVNDPGCIRYAEAIVKGYKPIETRTRDMLRALVGQRVAVIRTRRGSKPTVIGYVTITASAKQSRKWLDEHRYMTLIPVGSQFDCKGGFKWCYALEDPEECEPFELPASAIRHGRSWCEY